MYLEKLLDVLRGKRRVAIITHRHADIDALGCALVLKDVLDYLGYNTSVVCPEGPSKDARPYAECSKEPPPDMEMALLVDVASLSQVPKLDVPLAVFDHHAVGDELPGVRDERPSCSEMALELALEAGVRPKKDSLVAAALGIYADSVRLLRADSRTLRALAYAIENVGPLEKYARHQEDPSARTARLKALARLKIFETKLGTICATHVDAYESEVANLLISAGCDISIVASRHKDEVRVVYRSQSVDVGEIAARIGEIMGGSGGGHRGASVTLLRRKADKSELPNLLRTIVGLLDPTAKPLS